MERHGEGAVGSVRIFIINLQLSIAVKEILKSASILVNYERENSSTIFNSLLCFYVTWYIMPLGC